MKRVFHFLIILDISNDDRECLIAIKKIFDCIHIEREEFIANLYRISSSKLLLPENKEICSGIKTLESVRKFLCDKLIKYSLFYYIVLLILILLILISLSIFLLLFRVEKGIVDKCVKILDKKEDNLQTIEEVPSSGDDKENVEDKVVDDDNEVKESNDEMIENYVEVNDKEEDTNNEVIENKEEIINNTSVISEQESMNNTLEFNNYSSEVIEDNKENRNELELSPIPKEEYSQHEIDAHSDFIIIEQEKTEKPKEAEEEVEAVEVAEEIEVKEEEPKKKFAFKPKMLSAELMKLYDKLEVFPVDTTLSINTPTKQPISNESVSISTDVNSYSILDQTNTNNSTDSLTKSFLQTTENELNSMTSGIESSFESPNKKLNFDSPLKSISYDDIQVNTNNDIYKHFIPKKEHIKKRSSTPQPKLSRPTPVKKESHSLERSKSVTKIYPTVKKYSPSKSILKTPNRKVSLYSPPIKTKTDQQKRRECQELIKEVNNQLEVWNYKIPKDLPSQRWIKGIMNRMDEYKDDIKIPRSFQQQLNNLSEKLYKRKSISKTSKSIMV